MSGNEIGYYVFEVLIVASILLSWFMFNSSIKTLKVTYKTNRYKLLFALEIVAYLCLMLSMLKSFINLRLMYLFLWEFVISCFAILLNVPFSYNKKYVKSKIGSFYNDFSTNTVDLKRIILIIYDDEQLKQFLRPWTNMKKRENCGETIVSNLQLLKKQNISAYNRLLNKIEERAEPKTFTNLLSMAISFIGVVVALWNNNLFDGFRSIVENQNHNRVSFFFDCFILVIFIFIVLNIISLYVRSENRQFYKEVSLFFDEVKE